MSVLNTDQPWRRQVVRVARASERISRHWRRRELARRGAKKIDMTDHHHDHPAQYVSGLAGWPARLRLTVGRSLCFQDALHSVDPEFTIPDLSSIEDRLHEPPETVKPHHEIPGQSGPALDRLN